MTAGGILKYQLYFGYAASFIAAFAYGSVAVLGKKVTTEFASPLVVSAFSLLFGTALMSIVFAQHAFSERRSATRLGWLMVFLSGFFSAGGVTFFYLALSTSPVVLVAPIVAINPLITLLISHFCIGGMETVTWRTVLGGLLVVGGVGLVAVGVG